MPEDFIEWDQVTSIMGLEDKPRYVLLVSSSNPEHIMYAREALHDMRHEDGPKKGAPKLDELFEGVASVARRPFSVRGSEFTVVALHQTPDERVESSQLRNKGLELFVKRASAGYKPTLKQDNLEMEQHIKLVQDIVRECWLEAETGGPRWTRNKVLGWINDQLEKAGAEPFSTAIGRQLWGPIREVIPTFTFDMRTNPGQPTGFRPQPGVQFPAPIRGSV